MSLTINTNLSSLIVQSSLSKSTNGLNQAIERMTTGFKINGAKDNAAGYSIANSMGVKLSSFDVALDNVMLGTTLINTASNNLSLVTEHLQRMRDLAEQAANGTYGEDSLNAIQSEIDARTDEINRVMSNTEYNGIKLFAQKEQEQKQVTVDESKRVVNQTTFQSGETYYLTTSDDLVKLQDLVNSGVSTSNVTFELANDINMRGVDFRGIGTCGGDSAKIDSTKAFKGTFHGNGYSISNLTINTTEEYVGLFGYISGGTVDSLGIKNCNISGEARVGGLVGYMDSGAISSSYSMGSVNGEWYLGGLVGYMDSGAISSSYSMGSVNGRWYLGGLVGSMGSGSIESCYSTGNVEGSSYIGGLVGNGSSVTIENCYSTSSVTGRGENAGGLIGYVSGGDSLISSCYSTGNVKGGDYVGGLAASMSGTITNSYSTGNVKGNDSVGGLIGRVSGAITNSYSTGNVEGYSRVGGLIGGVSGTITNSYSTGNVKGVALVGGLAGIAGSGTITNSYSTGNVVGNGNYYVGGFVGVNNAAAITNSYYDTQKSGQAIGVGAGDGTGVSGVTTSELNDLISAGTLPSFTTGGAKSVGVSDIILQVGIDSSDSSKLTFNTDLGFTLNVDLTSQAGARTALEAIDNILSQLNDKQTELGSVQNRLESVLDSISVQYENLVSSRSTLRDADISEESSAYIKYQILQQASATLLATANQTPSIALQLL